MKNTTQQAKDVKQTTATTEAKAPSPVSILMKAFEGISSGHTIRKHYLSKFPICAEALKALEKQGKAIEYNEAKKGVKVPCPRSKVEAVIDYNALQFVKAVQQAGFFTTPKLLSPRYVFDVFRCYYLDRNKERFAEALHVDTQSAKFVHSAVSVNLYKGIKKAKETKEDKAMNDINKLSNQVA
jgi:hypothetical protein